MTVLPVKYPLAYPFLARMRARIEIACAERTHPSEAPNRDHGIDDEWRQNLGIRLRWGI